MSKYQKLMAMKESLKEMRDLLNDLATKENPSAEDLRRVRAIEKDARGTEMAIKHLRNQAGLLA